MFKRKVYDELLTWKESYYKFHPQSFLPDLKAKWKLVNNYAVLWRFQFVHKTPGPSSSLRPLSGEILGEASNFSMGNSHININ